MGCGASTAVNVRGPDTVEVVLDDPHVDLRPAAVGGKSHGADGAALVPQDTEVDQSNAGLTAVPNLRHYVHTQRLILDRNRFPILDVSPLPPSVQFLSVQACKVGNLNQSIVSLTALRSLHLGDNELSALPGVFGKLESLTSLNLSKNRFTVIPPAVLQLTALRTLDLSFNALEEIPGGIRQLTQLTELYASDNVLTSVSNEIGALTQLTRCDLSSNRLTMLPPSIARLTALVFLDTHNNPFSLSALRLGDTNADRVRRVIESSYTAPEVSAPTLVADMTRLLYEAPAADCRIVVDDRETLPCHKCILAARCSSRFWNEILSELNVGAEVRLYTLSVAAVRALLHFLYTESLPAGVDPGTLREVAQLGQACGMPRMQAVAEAQLAGVVPQPSGALVRDLYNLLRTHTHADLRIVCESSVVRAHRAIFCARSACLQQQLGGPGGRGSGGSGGSLAAGATADELVLRHPHAVVMALLEFLYTDAVTVGQGVAEPLLQLASELQLPRLVELCEVALSRTVDMTNVVSLYTLAHRLHAQQLVRACYQALQVAYPSLRATGIDPSDIDAVFAHVRSQPNSSVIAAQLSALAVTTAPGTAGAGASAAAASPMGTSLTAALAAAPSHIPVRAGHRSPGRAGAPPPGAPAAGIVGRSGLAAGGPPSPGGGFVLSTSSGAVGFRAGRSPGRRPAAGTGAEGGSVSGSSGGGGGGGTGAPLAVPVSSLLAQLGALSPGAGPTAASATGSAAHPLRAGAGSAVLAEAQRPDARPVIERLLLGAPAHRATPGGPATAAAAAVPGAALAGSTAGAAGAGAAAALVTAKPVPSAASPVAVGSQPRSHSPRSGPDSAPPPRRVVLATRAKGMFASGASALSDDAAAAAAEHAPAVEYESELLRRLAALDVAPAASTVLARSSGDGGRVAARDRTVPPTRYPTARRRAESSAPRSVSSLAGLVRDAAAAGAATEPESAGAAGPRSVVASRLAFLRRGPVSRSSPLLLSSSKAGAGTTRSPAAGASSASTALRGRLSPGRVGADWAASGAAAAGRSAAGSGSSSTVSLSAALVAALVNADPGPGATVVASAPIAATVPAPAPADAGELATRRQELQVKLALLKNRHRSPPPGEGSPLTSALLHS